VSLTIDAAAVPVYDGVLELIRSGCVPGGTRGNAVEHARFTTFAAGVDDALRMLLSDATTSGGLLIAVRPSVLQAMLADLASLPYVRVIGFAGDGPAGTIAVR
jgi:selenide,water dikinase